MIWKKEANTHLAISFPRYRYIKSMPLIQHITYRIDFGNLRCSGLKAQHLFIPFEFHIDEGVIFADLKMIRKVRVFWVFLGVLSEDKPPLSWSVDFQLKTNSEQWTPASNVADLFFPFKLPSVT